MRGYTDRKFYYGEGIIVSCTASDIVRGQKAGSPAGLPLSTLLMGRSEKRLVPCNILPR